MGVVMNTAAAEEVAEGETLQRPDATGHYGKFGGRFVPETLVSALNELTAAYEEAMADPAFKVSQSQPETSLTSRHSLT